MHAGSIENCSGGYGAGVRVGKGGTFVMDEDATISGCVSSNWGGGVYAGQATLIDIQGTVKDNSATYGGGVSVTYMKYSLTSFFPRKVQLSGATITNNKATYGGGVSLYNATTANAVSNCTIAGNEATVGGGVILWNNSEADFSGVGNKVCNNTATSGAADVFLNKAEDTLKLFDAAVMGETYRDTDEEIDGWYIDDPSYAPVENAEAVDVAGKLAGEKALVASYKVTPKATVTIDLGDGSDISTTIVTSGSTIGKPADPAREGYRFTGWYAEGSDTPFDFGQPVTSDLSIRAHWVRVFTVAFDYGDGRGLGVNVDQGSSVSVPADPVREGYRFLGWYADGSDAKFDFEAPVTSDVKLVAKWEKEGSAVDPSNPGGKDDPAKPGKYPSGSDDPGKPGDSDKGDADKPGSGDAGNKGDGDAADKSVNGGVDDNGREQVEMVEQAASSELPPTGDAALSVVVSLLAVAAVIAASSVAMRRRA